MKCESESGRFHPLHEGRGFHALIFINHHEYAMKDLLTLICSAQRKLRLDILPDILELITQEIYSKQ